MSLSDYRPPTAVVSFKGGDVEVRGISVDDIAILLGEHLPDLDALITIFSAKGVNPDNLGTEAVRHIVALVRQAPGVCANLIALAADEPDNVDKVRRYPMAVQINIIKEIARLTFDEAGGPKKFIEDLKMFLVGATMLTETGSPT